MLGRVAPAVLWAGVIFALSAQSDPPLPSAYDLFRAVLPTAPVETYAAIDFLLRKAGHFTEYAILAVLVHHALAGCSSPGCSPSCTPRATSGTSRASPAAVPP